MINPSNPKAKRAHNVRWIRLADHWSAAVQQRVESRARDRGPRLLLLVPAQTWGEPPRAAPYWSTESRPGTQAVNARPHLTPNPHSFPGDPGTVRLTMLASVLT